MSNRIPRTSYLRGFIALLISSLACNLPIAQGAPSSPTPAPTMTPAPTETFIPTPAVSPSPTLTPFHMTDSLKPPAGQPTDIPEGALTIALTVVNRSEETVCDLYISPSSDTNWGEDRLGSNGLLETGDPIVVMLVFGQYDLQALDCSQEAVAVEWQIVIDRDTIWNIGQGFAEGRGIDPSASPVTLTVINATQQVVCYLFISPTGEPSWGADWLDDLDLAPGEQVGIEISAGAYDLKAEDCNHSPIQIDMGVSILDSTAWRIEGD